MVYNYVSVCFRLSHEDQVMLGSPAGPGGASQRGLWPLAPAPAPPASSFTAEGSYVCNLLLVGKFLKVQRNRFKNMLR